LTQELVSPESKQATPSFTGQMCTVLMGAANGLTQHTHYSANNLSGYQSTEN
jgi:hypothetical protein